MIGDFISYASPLKNIPKLSHRWSGPYRVVDSNSELVYKLEIFATNERIVSHTSRICLYAEKELEIEVDVNKLPNTVFEVEKLLALANEKKMVFLKWKVIEDIEFTWETEASLRKDLGNPFEKLMNNMTRIHCGY